MLANIPKNQVLNRNTIEQREHEDDAAARRVLPVDEDGNPINQSNPLPVLAQVQGEAAPDTPEIFNISALTANTEVSLVLPINTAKIMIQSRNQSRLQFSFNAGESGTKYVTIWPGEKYPVDGIRANSILYIQASKPNETIEVLVWN